MLVCTWDQAGDASDKLAKSLPFPERTDTSIEMTSLNEGNLKVLYNAEEIGPFGPSLGDNEQGIILSGLHPALIDLYIQALGEEDFDGIQWFRRFRRIAERHCHQLWYCLAVLGHQDGTHFPFRENDQILLTEADLEWNIVLARRLIFAVSALYTLNAQGRIEDNFMGDWIRDGGWTASWGNVIRRFATRAGFLRNKDWERISKIPDGAAAYRELRAIVFGGRAA
ncbi:MAG TPA: hypothetical protein VHM90_04215 [Phycisphaerae bacterium]|jgi:hypothetical protein|nr:hypothetical protein [Phycisphaerae bacterium]